MEPLLEEKKQKSFGAARRDAMDAPGAAALAAEADSFEEQARDSPSARVTIRARPSARDRPRVTIRA